MSRQYARPDLPLVKVKFVDLKRMGIVTSRFDLHEQIKAGKIRAPNKNGTHMQSAAWWWWDDIRADLERERNSASADAGN